ncbi:formate dehydrogenase subunit gamma [Dokdonella koreensis]|uniref:Formate dehydrogenase O, gamma subunit n=1 Tax=Dokdonella koreensis DS-123 TaxID=1300342 RepID=A0A160DV52_9GAMM|nr:formate dehydrogenase subunit gamma [Dokdonella koreensis]ANB18010.1 Formate dehydrogenase O, gamma subunit [Dokdonella koreensis DS-123]
MSAERKNEDIVRYAPAMRINHWLVAISFVLLALSGLALFHPSLFWLSALFGGGPWTRILHPFIGLVMVLAFVVLGATLWRYNHLEARDWAWLRRARDVVGNREDRLPEVGRYNAGQKLLFHLIVLCLAGLLLSGIVMWRAYFAFYFPVDVIRFASLLHAFCATVLICAIVVHIYAAIWVKGSMRAMTRGTVSRGWAWKHHRAWFRQVMRGGERE